MHVDAILLDGSCIVNESMLTGLYLNLDALNFNMTWCLKYFIFE